MFRKQYVSVRTRVLATIILGIVVLFALLYVLATRTLSKSYLEIEHQSVVQDIGRAENAIEDLLLNQQLQLNDWSPWEDLYTYVETARTDRDFEFEESTLFHESLFTQDINGFFVSNQTGNIIHGNVVDTEQKLLISSSSLSAYLEENPRLIVHQSTSSVIKGIEQTPGGIALVVSKPVLKNDSSGELVGSVTIVRNLSASRIATLSEKTHLNITIHPLLDGNVTDEISTRRDELLSATHDLVIPIDAASISGYRLLRNTAGTPLALLEIQSPRPVYAQGQKTVSFFIAAGIAGLLAFGLFIAGLLEKLVISRFTELSRTVEKINTEKDISINVKTDTNDDIGKLGLKINQMLNWLQVAQKAETASKRQAMKLLKQVEAGKELAEQMVQTRTKELHNETARLLASINSLSFGFIVADEKEKVVLHNPALTSILKTSQIPETLGQLSQLLKATKQKRDDVLRMLITKAKTTKHFSEIKQISYDSRYLRIVCTPILSTEETKQKQMVIGYVLLIDDITELKNIERSREEFFSIASHELRTPLTAIRWNTFMLLSDTEQKIKPAQKLRLLDDVHNASTRLIGIVNDFLEVSRLEQRKITVDKKPFDLDALIKNSVQNLVQVAAQKSLTLTYATKLQEPCFAVGDESRVRQVLDNLIGNALKYSDAGAITISTEPHASYVKVFIKDTGIGISAQNQSRLFKKFQQANEDMLAREDSQSTGLGLYISKLVMNEMGGLVALEKSVLGEGSVFSFTLPLKKRTSQG